MKRIFSKLAVLLVLSAALVFLVCGTASAQSLTAHRQTVSTTSTQPLSCGWVIRSHWPTGWGVEITKWENTCNGSWHCEANDQTYYGPFTVELDAYNSSGQLRAYSYWEITPFQPGEIGNTPSLSGYSKYVCSAYPYVKFASSPSGTVQ